MDSMDYNQITTFLDKFKKIFFQKEELKKIVIKTITEEISYKIENNLIKIKNNYIYLDTSPIIRNEILIHKKQILLKLKKNLPNNIFSDIR